MDVSTEVILESMSDGFAAVDREWRFTYVNRAAGRHARLSREEMLGRNVWEVYPTFGGSQFERACRRAMDEGLTVRFEEFCAPLDVWFEQTVYPSAEGIAVYARAITKRKRAEEELRKQNEVLQTIIDNIPVMIRFLGPDGHVQLVNCAWERTLGWSLEEVQVRDFDLFNDLYPDPRERQRALDFVAAATGQWADFRVRVRDGRMIDATFANIRLSDGTNISIGQDITERKRAEEALRRSHEELERRVVERTRHLSAINEALIKEIMERERVEAELRRSEAYLAEAQRLSHTGSWAWNVATGDLFWSREHFRIFGLDPEETKPSYELFFQLLHTEDRSSVWQTFEQSVRERKGYEMDYRIACPDGSIRHIHSIAHPVFNQSGNLVEYVGTIIDTTERKIAEEQQRQLLRRLMAAQEEERLRIARQLHDQMGQDVSALDFMISTLKARYATQAELIEQLDSLKLIAKQLSEDIDFLVWELRPTALSDLGLLVALSNYVKTWSKHFGIHAELHTAGMEKDRLTDEIETVLYRVLQEALTNVAKHAEAGSVSVLLERRSDQVSLIVEDRGIGFDGAQAFGTQRKGVGLVGMRERVTLVGGALEIEAKPGGGVTIVARVPAPHVSGGGERYE